MGLESGNDTVCWLYGCKAPVNMLSDLLAHLPADTPTPLTPLVQPTSPTRHLAPRTPVTVTSSFEQQWEDARLAMERKHSPERGGADGKRSVSSAVGTRGTSGAGMTTVGSLGTRVDTGAKGKRRRGVGPGVT